MIWYRWEGGLGEGVSGGVRGNEEFPEAAIYRQKVPVAVWIVML